MCWLLCVSQIGVTFQPVEVEKNVFAPVVEAMVLKVGHFTGQNGEEKKSWLFTLAHHYLHTPLTRMMNLQYIWDVLPHSIAYFTLYCMREWVSLWLMMSVCVCLCCRLQNSLPVTSWEKLWLGPTPNPLRTGQPLFFFPPLPHSNMQPA